MAKSKEIIKFTVKKIRIIPPEKGIKNRMFIFPMGENRMENIVNRFQRPYITYKKELIPLVIQKLKKDFPKEYKKVKDNKWSWSQKAGCSCGCSPGFVSSGKDSIGIYVDVKITK